jgi:hypothetical protein
MANRVQLGKRGSDYGLFVSNPTTISTVNGTVSNNTSVALDVSNSSIKVGQTVTGIDISGSVTVSAISGTALTLSSAQTIADEEELIFHGVDVTDCADKDLSFNSNSARIGGIYRGGNQSSISNSTGLTWTDSDHPDLGYIPLIMVIEDQMGGATNISLSGGFPQYYFDASNMSTWSSTSSKLLQVNMLFDPFVSTQTKVFLENDRVSSGIGILNATNVKFWVLKIPCQYGKMADSTGLWD